MTSSSSSSPPTISSSTTDYVVVADVAVTKFKKFISLLDRNRTSHTRFRRGPPHVSQEKPAPLAATETMYSPASIQQRLPPPPSQTIHHHPLLKSGSFDRKDFPLYASHLIKKQCPRFWGSNP
ncbi:hypothetical protein L6452_32287 [Arctium lappa]|uniref:Uncharacterized protein n=1 Tax=Arctium lappa TaxID=4217 RepID=A0ACB8Z518_ARCLA|nr:hypothetical protein L6452_32287 [Arctium lappa]